MSLKVKEVMRRLLWIVTAIAVSVTMLGCNKSNLIEDVNRNEVEPPAKTHREEWAVGTKPYIDTVLEFCPSPGQFVNVYPAISEGDPLDSVLARCTRTLANGKKGLVSLGGFGGYITIAFDHRVVNREGPDIMIHGNAFRDTKNKARGSSEPGVVMVMVDENSNGLPDDGTWYELKGSGYDLSETVKNYKITYYRPAPNKNPNTIPSKPGHPDYVTDGSYIKWTDNRGKTGYIEKNSYHEQPYWPLNRLGEATITFAGTLLTNAARNDGVNGDYWTNRIWDYGYVDNRPNTEEKGFDIAWAIDSNGDPVQLEGIDFVRVYCCANEQAGWLGELSTEVTNAWDLNLLDAAGKVRPAVVEAK